MTPFTPLIEKARAVRIEDVIAERHIKLKGGVDRCGPCPICGGEDRFAINTKKQIFNCRGCGAKGDVISLVQHLDGCDIRTAVHMLTGEPKPNGQGKGNGLERAITKKKAKAAPPKDTPEEEPKETARKLLAATWEYTDQAGAVVFAVDRYEFQNPDGTYVLKDGKRKKTFRQRRPDPSYRDAWIANLDGITRVPYQLPELIEAVASNRLVVIPEGEACVDALRGIGVVATTNNGGAGKWDAAFAEHLRGADVVLLPDNDEPSWKHVNDIGASLVGISGRTRVLLLPDLPDKGDVRDWLAAGGTREQFDALIETAPDWQPPTEEKPTDEAKAKAEADEQKLIDELSRLSATEYDRRREEAADQIGIRRSTLDNQVNARRAQREAEEPPPLFGHWVVEPWPEAVDTGELILALIARVRRHIIVTDEQALTVALWVMFAWVHEAAAVHSPILLVTSAEANSGKTQLVGLVTHLVPRAISGTGISEAALFRSIEKWQPTIIVDEADVLLVDNEPLRAVINSGWTRGAVVLRCVGDDNEPHPFPTFCAKAIGMKGKRLPDTTMSRSIVIEMKRKKASERVTHFRSIDDPGLAEFRRRALRWADDNGEKLQDAEPDMPPGFDNRIGDNWSVLLAIADFAGGEWPTKARKAAAKLSKVEGATSIAVQALADIKAIFYPKAEEEDAAPSPPLDRISSAELVAQLAANAESPWAEWKGGNPITQVQLARVLKPFGIASETIRLESGGTPRGYMRSQFEDAWERYLPSE